MAVNAIDNATGKFGILTNQHVAALGTMHIDGWLGTELGDATKLKNSGTIDAAFVPFSNQGNWNTTTQARYGSTTYTNIRLGDESLTIQGLPTRKIGQSSGDTTGTITSRSFVCNIDYGSGLVQITNTLKYSNESIPGDSGGPVYYDDGDKNLWLIGMNFAGPLDSTTSTYGIGCRITEVMREFNVTPILAGMLFNTTDLENNEIRIDRLNLTYPANPQNAVNTHFTIPSEINGRTVTEIGSSAFANQTNIRTYTLPNTLKNIGNSAFSDCTQLTQISIPSSVTSIGQSAFQNCSSLTSVALPSGLTTIEMSTFEQCSSLQRIMIPESVVSIDSYAFWGCTALKSVNKQGQFATLGSGVFSACYALKNIFVPPERLSYYRGAPNWRNFASTIKSSQETISLMQYFNSASGYLSVGGVSWSDVGRVTFILNLGGGDVFYGSYAKTYIFDNPAEIPLINGYAYSEVVRVVRIGGPPMNMEIGIWLNNTDGIGVGLFFDYDTNGYCQVNAQVIVEYR